MKSKIAIALALAAPMLVSDQPALAQTCSYNNATASFGANYSNNAYSATPLGTCVGTSTGPRLLNSSLARTVISAPNVGDFKFLLKNDAKTGPTPTFEMVSSLSPDTKAFPDAAIKAPADGSKGCDYTDPGVKTLEDHLSRNFSKTGTSWATNGFPLFGTTYYYGDYNQNPPNKPEGVVDATSSYSKWAPFTPTQEYLYMDPTGPWGPVQGVTTTPPPQSPPPAPRGAYPVVSPGRTAGTGCSAQGLSAADLATCNTCVSTKGYYLRDGAVAGDLMKSVFTGAILNDYPPAWVHLAWGFGYVLNFQLSPTIPPATPMVPQLQLIRDQYQSHNAARCPSPPFLDHAGGDFEPWGSAPKDCSIAYPVYDFAKDPALGTTGRIQALGNKPVVDDQSNMEGGNSAWASADTFPGKTTSPSTPAGDMLSLANALQTFTTSTCKFCQPKAILYIGFGTPCAEDKPAGLPTTTLTPACTGECNYTNPAPECRCVAGTATNWLPNAANYLYQTMGIQSYFLGLGAHTAAMRRAAAEGHGRFINATDAKSFRDGLDTILNAITGIAGSSATSTVNAVQVNVAGQEEIIPRFVAKTKTDLSSNYDGHLLKYYLFNEFAANCTKPLASVPIPNAAQSVCNAQCVCPGGSCTATWLVDATCNLITPDKSGFLFQATWNNTALVPTNKGAVPVWDANDQLRGVADFHNRKVYTAIDLKAPIGTINSADGLYLLTATGSGGGAWQHDLGGGVSDAVAQDLIPYLGIQGTTMCDQIEKNFKIVGGPSTFPGTAANRLLACAKVILNFTLGQDIFNDNGLDPSDPNFQIINRVSMLGDIFHSSPQDIGPPPSENDCSSNTRRCVSTLFNQDGLKGNPDFHPLDKPASVVNAADGTAITNPGTVDAYQAYYLHQTFGNGMKLPRVTLFGANDGMLHAVQTACFVTADTSGAAPMPVYWDGPGTGAGGSKGSCVAGSAANGSELWAFIPPDLLGKLGYMLLSNSHQFFVDSTPMVRDIYAPDPATTTATKRYTLNTTAMDFKRIAIVGEREGGTHWFALDVTDPRAPNFRWIFPQPNTADELLTGQTWGDWVPNSPPIVPVRIAAPAGGTLYPTYLDSSGKAQSFQEKWVVLLPGGYDPYGVVGKNVYMLDAWTGDKLFQAQPNGSASFDFPFAALPAAVAWGNAPSPSTATYNNGFSDTALIGDLGGQVWTMRFNDVGLGAAGAVPSATAPVTNWYTGRAFKQYAADDVGAAASEYRMQHRNPIFQMISAARMPEGPLRAFIGSGDRANMADKGVGQCGIYNPLACGKQQCVMTTATNATLGSVAGPSGTSSYKGDIGATYISSTTPGGFDAALTACSPASTVLNSCVNCGADKRTANPGQPQYACVYAASGGGSWQCTLNFIPDDKAGNGKLETGRAVLSPDPYTDRGYFSRFLAFNVFDNKRTLFTTAAQTSTYDSNALTETNLTNLFPTGFSPVGPAPVIKGQVDGNAPGFYFNYPVLDERTATNSLLLRGCVSWYTMEPGQPCNANSDCTGGTCDTVKHTCNAPTGCTATATDVPARSAFLYQVNAVTGGSDCGLTSSTALRTGAPLNAFLLPPPPAQQLISINAAGQKQFSIVAPAGQLSPAASTAAGGNVPYNFSFSIEAPRELHQCRHIAAGTLSDGSACY
jgi:hypothetical protein